MTAHICFLTTLPGQKAPANSNHIILPIAFAKAGWKVSTLHHEQVKLTPLGVEIGTLHPNDIDLVWLLGFGQRTSFLDRAQILSQIDDEKFVTPPLVMSRLHSKYALSNGPLAHLFPQTYVSGDRHWLKQMILTGGEWIVKPPAGSYGQNVYRVSPDNPNLNAILELLTAAGYCVLQPFLFDIEQGEKRVLLANSQVIGCYLRRSRSGFRTNLSAGATCEICTLSTSEAGTIHQAAAYLQQLGVRYAAVDLIGDLIVEVNVANPGGLETLAELTGQDISARVVASLESHANTPQNLQPGN